MYENVNPFSALRRSLDEGGAGGAQPTTITQPEQSDLSTPGTAPKSILKKSTTVKGKKSVQYTPSTKRGRAVAPKRPPTPDLEVTIRPTSALDIVDEILAGQPSRRIGERTIPDTLLQINEPAAHAGAKKLKKQPEPSDRVLRDRPDKKGAAARK